MKRTDVINYIVKEKGYNSYLEIGIQDANQNFNHIKASSKVGVDPAFDGSDVIIKKTSDQYFHKSEDTFDCIFIDGDHSYNQSQKDFYNALFHLNEGGCILMHDVLPQNLEYTKPVWCGEVWKTAVQVSQKFDIRTYEGDHGVLVVFPQFKREVEDAELFASYPGLDKLKEVLNAVDDLEGLIPEIIISSNEQAESFFDGLSDDQLKEHHKEIFGFKPKGKFNREKVIAKILAG